MFSSWAFEHNLIPGEINARMTFQRNLDLLSFKYDLFVTFFLFRRKGGERMLLFDFFESNVDRKSFEISKDFSEA